jgi:hypothetical protein
MSVVWFGVVVIIVAWLAYRQGVTRGASIGYQMGFGDGVKQGKDEGMKAGIKAGIKQQLINNLAGQPTEGSYAELQQQVRKEIMDTLTAKPEQKKNPNPAKPSVLLILWKRFGGWFVLCLLIAVIAYLGR